MTLKMKMPKKLTAENWKTMMNEVDTVMLDCDGVLWKGAEVIKGSVEAVAYLKAKGKRVILLTNNSTKSQKAYAEKCKKLGFNVTSQDDIITTSHLVADYLKPLLREQDKVYIVGSAGIGHELDEKHIKHIGIGEDPIPPSLESINLKLDPDVKAVVVGFDYHISYPKIVKAVSYLRNPNCLFIASNDDETVPESDHPEFVFPGTGCLVAAVTTAAGRNPTVLGKPNKPVFDYVKKYYNINPSKTLMVGDRIRTDIQLATKFGMRSLLVLTGVTCVDDFEKPDFTTMLPEVFTQCLGDIATLH